MTETQNRPSTRGQAGVDVGLLIQQLKAVVSNPEAVRLAMTDEQRYELQHLARSASVALEEPFETLQRLRYCPVPLITTRIAQSNKIFDTLAASEAPTSFTTLLEKSKIPAGVLDNVLTSLICQDMAREVEPGRYTGTRLTEMLAQPFFKDSIHHFHDDCLPAFWGMNAVLNAGTSPGELAFKVGHQTPDEFYTWVKKHPESKTAFHNFLEAQFSGLPTFLSVVDVQREFARGITPKDAVFVDVGGGNGAQCELFRRKLAHVPGRVILQDSTSVLEEALNVNGMELMSYDYFTEQPIKNARIYYFRQIFHNNDDETCLRIFKSHAPAMGPNSVMIIDDKCLPNEKPPPGAPGVEYTAGLSLAMWSIFKAEERRRAHWERLIDQGGFEIVEIRMFSKFHDAAIIVRPKTKRLRDTRI